MLEKHSLRARTLALVALMVLTGSVGNVVWMDPQTQGFCILFTNYLRARAPWRLVHLSNAIAAAFM